VVISKFSPLGFYPAAKCTGQRRNLIFSTAFRGLKPQEQELSIFHFRNWRMIFTSLDLAQLEYFRCKALVWLRVDRRVDRRLEWLHRRYFNRRRYVFLFRKKHQENNA
jgi:hypothetical protein